MKKFVLTSIFSFFTLVVLSQARNVGKTAITEWPYAKNGAVSITYDDGSYNQFKDALPIMERMGLPATFFIITGGIPGSKYQGKFVGRPVKEIIAESAIIPTNAQNFLERCSAAGYLGFKGTIAYHTKAAGLYDEHDTARAYKLMDSLYGKVRHGDFEPGYQPCDEYLQEKGSTWEDFRADAAKGYEFASHSITHAGMPGLDSANIVYELNKSKEEMLNQLGARYTFSCEVPYGYENERVMQIAYKIYPALRNRMPEPWLKEIDRPSKKTPGATDKDYIQWQREINTRAPLSLMRSWVDTTVTRKDTWLVLVIHGVDGLGYEARPSSLLDEYFQYIKSKDANLWVATFGNVTKYMRERENVQLTKNITKLNLNYTITNPLNKLMYNVPLTVKTYVPVYWKHVVFKQDKETQIIKPSADLKGFFVIYQVDPNGGNIILSRG